MTVSATVPREVVARLPPEGFYRMPRWSPDDQSIAFQVGSIEAFELRLDMIDVASAQRRELARGSNLQGLTWRRDNSGVVYASSKGSTLLYPPSSTSAPWSAMDVMTGN